MIFIKLFVSSGWLQKKRYRYTSHKIQDDFLDLMEKDVLGNISSRLMCQMLLRQLLCYDM